MSWGCGAGNTRSTTLADEAEAAAAGTQIDNQTLIDLLMGRLTVGVNPSPTAADGTWPDEEHVALARHAIEHPYLVVHHPKNAVHPLCVKCGNIAASTLVVPAPGSIPEWPACKGMFPNTHCRLCATDDAENKYVYEPASCGCGVTQSTQRLTCSECYTAENELKDCSTEGCGEKRHGKEVYCKSCRSLNAMCPMSCFLCGEGITRNVRNTKRGKKAGIRACIGKDNMDCFRRCNAYKGGVRGEKGGNDGRCLGERYFNKTKQKSTVKHAAQAAAKLAAPFLLGKFSTRSSTDALYKVGLKVAGE
jgi:hypothetical protein